MTNGIPVRPGENAVGVTDRKEKILREVPAGMRKTGLDILGVGCGAGIFGRRLAGEPGIRKVVALDPMTESAGPADERSGAAIEILRWKEKRFPFADETFDVSLSTSALPRIPVPSRFAFVSEIKRVTKRGGKIVFLEPNPWNPLTRFLYPDTATVADPSASSVPSMLRLSNQTMARVRY
ncbi:MAG: hypothetical protein BWY49_01141 [Candidatus Omnitrophica bacterium ADurb.Bin314]|nr:MAG: hypothetical protein BWY49_01141 [Candidatus Omnitrophica bacterium ADurb.Bin314]